MLTDLYGCLVVWLQMHTDAKNVETCLGTALDAAFNIMQHIGGKMVVCQTSLPSFGKGKLKHRYVLGWQC